jgi:light-regulated signal transduction histidine kinase (bacteriophytochrome)
VSREPTPLERALAECASEPIHRLGRIQAAGFLLAVDPGGHIAHVSANSAAWVGRTPRSLLGAGAESALLRQALAAAAAHARVSLATLLICTASWPRRADQVDVSIHDGGGLLVTPATKTPCATSSAWATARSNWPTATRSANWPPPPPAASPSWRATTG